jgi:hypothetical protein
MKDAEFWERCLRRTQAQLDRHPQLESVALNFPRPWARGERKRQRICQKMVAAQNKRRDELLRRITYYKERIEALRFSQWDRLRRGIGV